MALKVAIVGAHGSGKTTLAYQVVAALKARSIVAVLCAEVARESHYISSKMQVPEMHLDLFGRQIAAEAEALRTSEVVVCDRSLLDGMIYSQIFFGSVLTSGQRELFLAMEDFVSVYMKSYDTLFRTVAVYKPSATKDKVRPLISGLQERFNQELVKRLVALKLQYTDVHPDTAVRKMVTAILNLHSYECA